MSVDRVNASAPDQTHQVHALLLRDRVADGLSEDAVLEKRPVLDRLRDANEVLRHDATRTEVEVADFAVADLALGKANREAGRIEQRHWETGRQYVPCGRGRERDRVSLPLCPVAPAIEDDENDWPLLV